MIMAQVNKQINKAVLLLIFLLLNSFIISCDCKGGKEQGEKGKLEAEEKVLIDKLKKQFKPELQEEAEKVFKKDKAQTKQVLENSIRLINTCYKL